jgi:ornithine cyclodeaminase/alanine dehydrogenase-like protein (mu-crystallin family)
MEEVIGTLENGFKAYKNDQSNFPVRLAVDVEKVPGVFLFMPGYLKKDDSFGSKIVSVFPDNPNQGIPTIHSVYLLHDPLTGELMAIIDGILLTAIRTGATSALATSYLARKKASVLGIIGAGVQARYQAEGICAVRTIKKIFVYDIHLETAQLFKQSMIERHHIPVDVLSSANDVAGLSDILVTATTSKEPVFDGSCLKPGTHINAVGAFTEDKRELDTATVQNARIIVDTYEGCMKEAGDLLIPMRSGEISEDIIWTDLGEIITGEKPGRQSEDEITVFESVGFALEDLVTARLAYKRAVEKKMGLEFRL